MFTFSVQDSCRVSLLTEADDSEVFIGKKTFSLEEEQMAAIRSRLKAAKLYSTEEEEETEVLLK